MEVREIKSVIGQLKKAGSIWMANIPDLKLSSHGLNPKACVDSLIGTINHLSGENAFLIKVLVDDQNILVISSPDVTFDEFVELRKG